MQNGNSFWYRGNITLKEPRMASKLRLIWSKLKNYYFKKHLSHINGKINYFKLRWLQHYKRINPFGCGLSLTITWYLELRRRMLMGTVRVHWRLHKKTILQIISSTNHQQTQKFPTISHPQSKHLFLQLNKFGGSKRD